MISLIYCRWNLMVLVLVFTLWPIRLLLDLSYFLWASIYVFVLHLLRNSIYFHFQTIFWACIPVVSHVSFYLCPINTKTKSWFFFLKSCLLLLYFFFLIVEHKGEFWRWLAVWCSLVVLGLRKKNVSELKWTV